MKSTANPVKALPFIWSIPFKTTVMITVDITDDHKMVINGLKDMLASIPGMRVGYTYEEGASLLRGLQKSQPDMLLLDIQLPDVRGDELAKLIVRSYPLVKIIALTGFNMAEYARLMLEAGASGYLLKNTDEYKLRLAIETVHKGGKYIEPAIHDKLNEEKYSGAGKSELSVRPNLTRREKDILNMILKEMTSTEMAEALKLSLRTVENHRVSLMQKLDARNMAGIVKKAFQLGLVK